MRYTKLTVTVIKKRPARLPFSPSPPSLPVLSPNLIHLIHTSNQYHLFRHSNNNRLHLMRIILVNLYNLQSGLIDQALPFGLGALDRAKRCHHGDVQIGGLPGDVDVGEDDFVNDDARVGAQGGDGGLEDFDRVPFGPVVQHVAKVVEFGSLDGLGLEEVVFLELDAWDWLGSGEGGWDVLDDDSAG